MVVRLTLLLERRLPPRVSLAPPATVRADMLANTPPLSSDTSAVRAELLIPVDQLMVNNIQWFGSFA